MATYFEVNYFNIADNIDNVILNSLKFTNLKRNQII